MKYLGVLCIISAPSGAGKSTLIKALMRNSCFFSSNIKLSISYTTRDRRPGEIHGKDYYFVSIKEFKYMIDANLFFEYAKVFNYYYGTLKSNIVSMLSAGIHVILDIDWNGAQQIRNQMLTNIYTVFILPPSRKELENRLRNRAQDTDKIIALRMKEVVNVINHITEYDYVIVNDNFSTAFRCLKSIILSEQLRCVRQKIRYKNLINSLLKFK